jgi:16S rRNA (uracil1498-N3)-methyltransferase
VPVVAPIATLESWLGHLPQGAEEARHLLSFAPDAQPATHLPSPVAAITLLSGPEGGLDPREEDLARAHHFLPLSLGPRVLRADTAPLAVLAYLGLR